MKHNQSTESKIVQAATEVFLERGRDGARMQEIADRAGINKALLHYYFRSKEKLYDFVFRRQAEEFFGSVFNAVIDIPNFREFLRTFVQRYLQAISQRPALVRFVLWEMESGAHIIGPVIRSQLENRGLTQNPLVVRIERAIQEGEIRRLDPVHLIISIMGLSVIPFVARPLIEQIFPDVQVLTPEFIQKREEEVFQLLWRGVRPE